jgi:hypothetical protein
MESRNNVWMHYVKNIIAADVPSAVFLATYLRYSKITRDYVSYLEIVDLQKYRVIRKAHKVNETLTQRLRKPFIFVIGKN